jgi:hypothetical protein
VTDQAGDVMGSPFLPGGVFDAYWKAGHGANGATAGEPAASAPRPDPARDPSGGEVTMSEDATNPAAEYDALESEAAELLGHPAAETDLNASASALIRRMRKLLKQHGDQVERARTEGHKQAFAELAQQRQTEAAFRRLSVPETARALFAGVDVADQQAMAQRAEELRLAGVTWSGQPVPPPPPPPDPNLASMQAMVQAEAGGSVTGNGDLQARLERMAAEPEKYSDEQVRAVIGELNGQVRASTTPGSGALG